MSGRPNFQAGHAGSIPVIRSTVASSLMRIFHFGRKPEHRAGVVYVYLKKGEEPPYYSVVCACGWFAEPVETSYPNPAAEQQMVSAARAHDPQADTSVEFPLDRPPQI